ncbi:MAG: hypothetical protein H0V33_07410, partial [Acidimicrobiia bacterium]|nr:hypothetical protein [Acidimicrobiia bacterium]
PSFVGGDVGPVHDFAARFNLSVSIAYEESVWEPGLVTLQSPGSGEPIVPGMPFSVNVSTPPGEIIDGTHFVVVDPGRTGIFRPEPEPDPFRPGRFDRIGTVFRPGGGIG